MSWDFFSFPSPSLVPSDFERLLVKIREIYRGIVYVPFVVRMCKRR